jgi:hypothetical protein
VESRLFLADFGVDNEAGRGVFDLWLLWLLGSLDVDAVLQGTDFCDVGGEGERYCFSGAGSRACFEASSVVLAAVSICPCTSLILGVWLEATGILDGQTEKQNSLEFTSQAKV